MYCKIMLFKVNQRKHSAIFRNFFKGFVRICTKMLVATPREGEIEVEEKFSFMLHDYAIV